MKSLQSTLGLLMVLFSVQQVAAQSFCQQLHALESEAIHATADARSDSFDVLDYSIQADFRGYVQNPFMEAYTTIRFVALQDLDEVRLDLLELEVTQVKVDLSPASFTYSSPVLKVYHSMQAGDTASITVGYKGKPVKDPQWGGFYFQGEYAYNLGVGFAADPHNFGRVWFPCVDNFMDRATYFFMITVDSGYKAYCNGELRAIGVDTTTGDVTYHWHMDDPIPTYLASLAMAPYEELRSQSSGGLVTLTALAKDTANVRSHFVHLPQCIDAFIDQYGTHAFDRVGFNVVPFNGGAMEHATNIAYPYFAVRDGGLDYETLYAHELAHHWWGNAVTCADASEMWLNEGWASYSERVFLEAIYGREAYKDDIRSNHQAVVHHAHLRDGEVLPVSGVDHARTYGMHVYDKGADMVHTLRGYMGDSAFFAACVAYQEAKRFMSVRTDDLEDFFQGYTTVDLEPFFRQWIKAPGFAHFYIQELASDATDHLIRIKQNQRFTDQVYEDVVHYLSAFDTQMHEREFKILIPSNDNWIRIPKADLGFEPVYWALDFQERISDAITDQWILADSAQAIAMDQALFSGELVATGDSTLLRVEHHWVSPDHYFLKIPGLAMSKDRYWTLGGIWNEQTRVDAVFAYNGQRPINNPAFGYLDHELIRIVEDSLVLLYRPNAHSDWQIHPDYSKQMGSVFDRRGSVTVQNAQAGQYTFGMFDSQLLSGVESFPKRPAIGLYPNPAHEQLTITFEGEHACCYAEVTDQQGRSLIKEKIGKNKQEHSLDIRDLSPGIYYLGLIDDGKVYEAVPFLVK